MKNWKILKKELLKDKVVGREYERLTPRYQLISALIEARRKKGMTQAMLGQTIGKKQAAIARLESGRTNPTLGFLEKITEALGSRLVIQTQ